MSLINQVLQDLEQRGARPAQEPVLYGEAVEGRNVTPEIRPVAVTRRQSSRLPIGWLLLLGAVLAVSLSLWNSRVQVSELIANGREQIDALVRESGEALLSESPGAPPDQAEVREPARPAMDVQAQVNAALMVPVFQLSSELASLPAQSQLQIAAETRKRVAAGSQTPTVVPVAATVKARAAHKPVASDHKQQSETARVRRKEPAQSTHASAPATVEAKTDQSDQTASVASITRSTADDAPEEIVIAGDLAPQGPIEKQARQLTTFRQAVANLRKGRMVEAEAKFREAISEDRSHAGARQALVGLLINSGRLADARGVLADSLEANPRQPGLAMLLARLQVDSGELGAALQTLERTGPYAVEDADYRAFMAAVLQRAGRHEEAVGQFRDALTLTPGNPVWMMGMGISLRALGQNGLAKEVFASAAATHALNPDLQAFVEQQQHELEHALN